MSLVFKFLSIGYFCGCFLSLLASYALLFKYTWIYKINNPYEAIDTLIRHESDLLRSSLSFPADLRHSSRKTREAHVTEKAIQFDLD